MRINARAIKFFVLRKRSTKDFAGARAHWISLIKTVRMVICEEIFAEFEK